MTTNMGNIESSSDNKRSGGGGGHVVWQQSGLTREDRRRRTGHAGCVVWFTGLPGAGKSTLAFALEKALHERGAAVYVLDGDNVRHGLCRGLGFSPEDRRENIRRVGEVSKLFVDAGLIVIAALVSPSGDDRRMVRELFPEGDYIEAFVDCPVEECERRDPKGMYRKARDGQIAGFTGVSAGYDVPATPELTIPTHRLNVEQSVALLLRYLEERGCLPAADGVRTSG